MPPTSVLAEASTPAVVEIFDGEFKYLIEVPAKAVVHRPPPHLNITRLVVCRNYVRGNALSCAMGSACKFVHVDADLSTLAHHPIHVKYAWQRADLCTYPRLAGGKSVNVTAPSSGARVEAVRSELVLVTAGSEHAAASGQPVALCTHYHFKRMCNRGERCNFAHLVYTDPNVAGDFQRAPPGLHRTERRRRFPGVPEEEYRVLCEYGPALAEDGGALAEPRHSRSGSGSSQSDCTRDASDSSSNPGGGAAPADQRHVIPRERAPPPTRSSPPSDCASSSIGAGANHNHGGSSKGATPLYYHNDPYAVSGAVAKRFVA